MCRTAEWRSRRSLLSVMGLSPQLGMGAFSANAASRHGGGSHDSGVDVHLSGWRQRGHHSRYSARAIGRPGPMHISLPSDLREVEPIVIDGDSVRAVLARLNVMIEGIAAPHQINAAY